MSPEDYTAHCLRVGACTGLMEIGVPLPVMNTHVGWSPNSTMWNTYNRPGLAPRCTKWISCSFLVCLMPGCSSAFGLAILSHMQHLLLLLCSSEHTWIRPCALDSSSSVPDRPSPTSFALVEGTQIWGRKVQRNSDIT